MIPLHKVALVSGNMEANFARLVAWLGLADDTNWEPEVMLERLRSHMTHFLIDVEGEQESAEEVELSTSNLRMAVFLFRRVSAHGNETVFEVDNADRSEAAEFFGMDLINEALHPVLKKHKNLKRFMSPRGEVTVRIWRQSLT